MPVGKPAAVLLIVVDALRARNLSCYGYRKPSSPNIDQIASDGVLFENAFSCSNCTDPSVTSILSGLHPISHGIVNHGPHVTPAEPHALTRRAVELLPEKLQSRGYATIGVDCMGRWHRRGFDLYVDYHEGSGTKSSGDYATAAARVVHTLPRVIQSPLRNLYNALRPESEINAGSITDRAIELIRTHQDKPFFLYVHYWDVHFPYQCRREYFTRMSEQEAGEDLSAVVSRLADEEWRGRVERFTKRFSTTSDIVAKYDGAISFVDSQIGRLAVELEAQGLLDQTLILVTSDHGESLTEHGIYFDHHGLYDETIHVPLVVRYPPRLPRNRRISGLVQHVDLLPTIISLIDGHVDEAYDGSSLIPLVQDTVPSIRSTVYAEETWVQAKHAVRTEEYKYIRAVSEGAAVCRYCGTVHGGVEELYNLANDPLELHNIVDQRPGVAKALHRRLSESVDSLRGNAREREKAAVTRAIRSLGASNRF